MNFEDCDFAIRIGESEEGLFLQSLIVYCPSKEVANKIRGDYLLLKFWNKKFGSREVLIYWRTNDNYTICDRPYQIPKNMAIRLAEIVPIDIKEIYPKELENLQSLLQWAGFFSSKVNGSWDEPTQKAWLDFLQEEGLEKTEELNEENLRRLQELAFERGG